MLPRDGVGVRTLFFIAAVRHIVFTKEHSVIALSSCLMAFLRSGNTIRKPRKGKCIKISNALLQELVNDVVLFRGYNYINSRSQPLIF